MLFLLLAGATTATANGGSNGGAVVPGKPAVRAIKCVSTSDQACAAGRALVRGGTVRIAGSSLGAASKVVFRGRATRRDDVTVRARHPRPDHVDASVPGKARTGPITVVDKLGRRVSTRRAVKVVAPAPIDVAPGSGFYLGGRRKPALEFTARAPGPVVIEVVRQADGIPVTSFEHAAIGGQNVAPWDGLVGGRPAPSGLYTMRVAGSASAATAGSPFALYDHLFPIRGKHNLGYTNTNQFGGGRGHQGIDMFARCGTRLAVARGGKVQYAGYHSRAGNYAVIDGGSTGTDYVYMHMRRPPLVRTGQRVFTGQKLGEVGDTGRATGCHLHFETWSAPGWYEGGRPFDARPALERWRGYR